MTNNPSTIYFFFRLLLLFSSWFIQWVCFTASTLGTKTNGRLPLHRFEWCPPSCVETGFAQRSLWVHFPDFFSPLYRFFFFFALFGFLYLFFSAFSPTRIHGHPRYTHTHTHTHITLSVNKSNGGPFHNAIIFLWAKIVLYYVQFHICSSRVYLTLGYELILVHISSLYLFFYFPYTSILLLLLLLLL